MKRITQAKIEQPSRVVVVFCVRNEKFRLPFFLDYYRDMGITQFYAIDNGSTDGTFDYLKSQGDVNLFSTDASYKSSNAGRDWTSEVCKNELNDRWCLTLDVDEFFIYPYMEALPLSQLIDYLESNNYDGATSLFLDFYSNKNLSKTNYDEGDSVFDVCGYFDQSDQYSVYPDANFPFVEIKGGPRQRTFWQDRDIQDGPSMRKTVLVKWQQDFSYLVAAHSCTPIRLADFTTVVAHFKFLSHFKEFAKQEVARNERVSNSKDWRIYASALDSQDINFYNPEISCAYEDSLSLLQQKLMVASSRYAEYASTSNLRLKSNALKYSFTKSDFENNQDLMSFAEFLAIWNSYSTLSTQVQGDPLAQQELIQIEHKLDLAASSWLWKVSYRFRKLASKFGLTDQRSLTEENYTNQNLVSRFTFIYDSIWWDLLGPFRAILKILRRLGVIKYRK